MNLLIRIVLLISTPFFIVAESQNESVISWTPEERKAIRREMIDLDIQTRTLASVLTFNNAKLINSVLEKFPIIRTSMLPEHQKGALSAYQKFKNKGVYNNLEQIYSITIQMKKEIELNTTNNQKSISWSILEKQFTTLLSNCRVCHQKVLK